MHEAYRMQILYQLNHADSKFKNIYLSYVFVVIVQNFVEGNP